MEQGTKVFRAYVCVDPTNHWIDEGEVTGIVADGVPLVRHGEVLTKLNERWHRTRAAAKGEAAAALARHIGSLQAKLDTIRDEILHEDLTTEEVAA